MQEQDCLSINKNEKLASLKRWGAFLGIALLALIIVVLPYIIRGHYFVWLIDGVSQHATFLEYTFKNGLFKGAGNYDYAVGLGSDYMVAFSYYMMYDPLNLLLYILPRGNFLLSYSIVIFIKQYLCAVCMYVYLRSHSVRQTLSVIFSVAYMLSGYVLYTFTRHPDLTSGAVFLPLVILGTEKTIDGKQPFLLIASVFVITISSFYMAYMVTVFTVAYAALYYVYNVKPNVKGGAKTFAKIFFKTAGYYALGLILASFLLVPVAYGYLHGTRSAGKGVIVYSFKDLAAMAGVFFVPASALKYTEVMTNIVTIMLASSAFATKRSPLKILTVVLTAGVFVPLMGYIMNLFNYASNRFTFMLLFCVFALIPIHINQSENMPANREINFMVRGAVTSLTILANIALWALVSVVAEKFHPALAAFTALVAIVALCGSVYGLYRLYKYDFSATKHAHLTEYKRMLIAFIAVTFLGAFIFNCVYSAQFDDGTLYYGLRTPGEEYVSKENKEEFFRTDQYAVALYTENRALNNDAYFGTYSYNTMSPESVHQFLSANEVYMRSHGSSGLDARTALQALMCVKYYRIVDCDYVPAGFEKVEGYDDLFKTDNYLNFGTVFSSAVSYDTYNSLDCIDKQFLTLTAVVKEGGEDISFNGLAVEQPYIYGKEAFVLKGNDTLNVTLPDNLAGKELYVRIILNGYPKSKIRLSVASGDAYQTANASPKGGQMFTGQLEFTFKTDECGKTFSLINELSSDASIKTLTFYTVEGSEVLSLINAAKQNPHLTDTQFTKRGFTGNINSNGGYMLVQLPYSQGFKAYVDGKQTKIYNADAGLMAIEVPQGEHKIEFAYFTPWLTAGRIISVISAAVLVVLIAVYAAVYVIKTKGKHKGEQVDSQIKEE